MPTVISASTAPMNNPAGNEPPWRLRPWIVSAPTITASAKRPQITVATTSAAGRSPSRSGAGGVGSLRAGRDRRAGALLIVNDRPHVALAAGADGVHVGQDDMPVAEARKLVGPELLIGLSTHAREEVVALDASQADYIGVGPVHETPTKPGRPAVGIELVRYAAEQVRTPFFAIGGLHAGNLAPVLEAGARRAVVLRAIAAANDPQTAARVLRGLLEAYELDG